jgi:hypothetical protein
MRNKIKINRQTKKTPSKRLEETKKKDKHNRRK